MLNRGPTMEMGGNMATARAPDRINRLPGNSRREMA